MGRENGKDEEVEDTEVDDFEDSIDDWMEEGVKEGMEEEVEEYFCPTGYMDRVNEIIRQQVLPVVVDDYFRTDTFFSMIVKRPKLLGYIHNIGV